MVKKVSGQSMGVTWGGRRMTDRQTDVVVAMIELEVNYFRFFPPDIDWRSR